MPMFHFVYYYQSTLGIYMREMDIIHKIQIGLAFIFLQTLAGNQLIEIQEAHQEKLKFAQQMDHMQVNVFVKTIVHELSSLWY